MSALSPETWTAIRLTIELATLTTVILLVVGAPIAWWLARSRSWWKEPIATVIAMPLVLPPTVLGFYLLLALGPNGPGGMIAGLWNERTLAFTFEGLVIGSVAYSMPFVVQPIRNAFEAMGDRPLEVAATLRASPWRAFWTVAVPLARPGFLSGAVLGFAHTVGEFGIVLMIGGSIPGKTKVLSVAVYDYVETMQWREANILAAGMAIFAFIVILAMTLIEKRVARAGRCWAAGSSRRVFAARSALSRSTRRSKHPRGASRRCLDRRAAARRRCSAASPASTGCVRDIARSTARHGKTRHPSCQRTSVPSAMSFRKRACFRISACGATCSMEPAARGARDNRTLFASTRLSICLASRPCSIGRRVISPAASASASRSAARYCPSQASC